MDKSKLIYECNFKDVQIDKLLTKLHKTQDELNMAIFKKKCLVKENEARINQYK